MWIATISVFLIIVVVWLFDFQGDMYALMNPAEIQEVQSQDTVVAEDTKEASPFAALLSVFGDIKSGTSDFINKFRNREKQDFGELRTLPLSE